MNEEPRSLRKKLRRIARYLRRWLILSAATFVVLLTVTQFLPGGRRSFSDWLPAVLFLLVVSLAIPAAFLVVGFLVRCLCSWRNVKRVALAGACVIFLIALFYAEENWRGWHAWNQFKNEWEAKGEHFELASLVPPPVPAEQNFALTPIAFTSYGGTLTRDGKPVPAEKRDEHFVVRMRMPIARSYPGPANCAGDRVKGTFTSLEGWQSYYRNGAAQSNEFPVPAQPQSPAADVLLALSRYDTTIEELRLASQLPWSRFPVNYDSESPWAILLPHLAPLKSCAQALQLRSVAELQDGQPDQALEDVRLALQLTDKIRTEPLLISHLVRLAMVQLALQPIWEGLAQHKWSDAQMAVLDTELAKLDFVSAYRLGLRGELGAQGDVMNFLRRHPEKLRDFESLRDFDGKEIVLNLPGSPTARGIPAGWFYQNQYGSARMIEDYYLPLANADQGTFSPDVARRGNAILAAECQSASPYKVYARLILPVLGGLASKFAYGQGSVNLARTAMALERCRLVRGEYPETLAALVPQFVARVPHDVINGQPLKYRREADGCFVLYSVGWNETDEGGLVGLKNDGSVDIQSGDWVWRYPSKAEIKPVIRNANSETNTNGNLPTSERQPLASGTREARVSVDAAQTVQMVDSRLFGINTAIWDAVLDTPETVAALRELDLQALRFPGGSFSDSYHWATGTFGPNSGPAPTSFLDFIHTATNLPAQVIITVNYGSGTPEEAAAWVRCANVTNRCGFKYWEIGNENYGNWERDDNSLPHDPVTYATRAKEYFRQMKAADPTIKIGVVVTENWKERAGVLSDALREFHFREFVIQGYQGWTPRMLATLNELGVTPDWVSLHYYPQNIGFENDARLLQSTTQWAGFAALLRRHLRTYFGNAHTNVEMLCTENNSVSQSTGKQTTSLVNGLYLADSFGQIAQTESKAFLWWDLRNAQDRKSNNDPALYGWRDYGDHGIMSGHETRYPTFYSLKLLKYFARGGDRIMRATSDHKLLSVYAARRLDSTLTLLIINKSPHATLTANFSIAGFRPKSSAMVYSYGVPQDEAARTGVGSPDIAQTSFADAATEFPCQFPPYSATVMVLSPNGTN